MKKRVIVEMTRWVEIEIPDDKVQETESSWKECMQSRGTIDDVFKQIATFVEDDFIEGAGKSGEDFIILETNEDWEYEIEDIEE